MTYTVTWRCGTCGDRTLKVESPVGNLGWHVTCGNNHRWAPTLTERIAFTVPIHPRRRHTDTGDTYG